VTSFLKSEDPNHLVLDGHNGVDPASLDSTTVDLVTQHFYPSPDAPDPAKRLHDECLKVSRRGEGLGGVGGGG
jgi:hypothetical protein